MVGIIVTSHQGKLRPQGQELINRFISSCNTINYKLNIYVFDNSSNPPMLIPNHCKVTYVEDQTKRGLTGTWNDGVNNAVKDGCDTILISNDDVELNSSINKFIDDINDDNTIYGPLSDGVWSGVQRGFEPTEGFIDLTNNESNMCNGFFMGFNKNFVNKYIQSNGMLFNEKHPWGGNEEEFQKRVWKQGAKSIVNKSCFLHHTKLRGWVQFNQS